jgi:hypothetical protein
MKVSVLGYCWDDDLNAGYVRWHRKALKLVGLDMTINHLALQFNDWVVHPFSKGFSGKDIKWIKERVSARFFGEPCEQVHLGSTDLLLSDIIAHSEARDQKLWSNYAWFYTLGFYKNKRDCVSFTKEMLDLCLGIGPLKAQTPYCLLKEISNHGYGSA